jgi:hypothetical protein
LITEDILTEMQKLGLKEGGAVEKPAGGVKQPAAYIDGSEFVEAAQKYGIKDSMDNLNKIVNLVNKGLSVDDAARQVAGASQLEVKKADGGAINFNTAPDMSDGGRIIQGAPFKRGGKVNMTANRDTMFMELSNKKLKRK